MQDFLLTGWSEVFRLQTAALSRLPVGTVCLAGEVKNGIPEVAICAGGRGELQSKLERFGLIKALS